MLNNYIKIAFRNLTRNKVFTTINVGGLAIGLACCVLIFVFIQDELSYDRFHENAEQIYRVTFSTNLAGTPTNANGIFGVGPGLKRDFPEVLEFTRIRKTGQLGTKSLVRYEDKNFYEERFFFADSTVFDLFSFPFLQGNPRTALVRPNTVVITEETARKYFPDEDPVGKVLFADPFGQGELTDFEITGVLEDIPRNSHLKFDFLASLYSTSDDLEQFAGLEQVFTYVLLQKDTSQKTLEASFLDFLHRNWRDDPWYAIGLQSLLDIHLHSQLRSEIQPNGNIRFVQIFAIIAIFILVIASINFMNLVTARAIKRAKEVGVRKAAGATRGQLIWQFLTESVMLSLTAGILSIFLVELFTPVFNSLAGKEIRVLAYFGPAFIFGFAGLVLILGILAGSYPAFLLSRFKPVNTLKTNFSTEGSGAFMRKGLVVFQFAISMALITVTGIVYSQLNYIQTKDLGYAEDQIMVLPLNEDTRNQYESFRNELLQYSGISNMTTSSLVPTLGSSHNAYKIDGIEGERQPSFSTYLTDEEFVETYGLRILAGSEARRDVTGDGGDFMFSELAVRELGWEPEEILGRSVEYFTASGRATGVVNDIHIYSFRENMYASAYMVSSRQFHKYLSVRLNPSGIPGALLHAQEVWESMFPGYPFDYFFLDESFERMHRTDMQLAKTITWFAMLAIFVACLGLFGLSAFMAEQRVKEIGIRKVMGATLTGIVALFSRNFLKLVLLGAAIAVPVAWYFGNNWLKDFAYRVDIGAEPFILAASVILFIALATISYHSIKAAMMNPVDALRSE